MKYNHVVTGIFRERPNRFIAYVEINGVIQVCHVKNTGRCKELLVPGCTVFLEYINSSNRKTKYDLISVRKDNGLLINIDSQAPNKAVKEWIEREKLFQGITLLKPEEIYGNSRLDFYIETVDRKIFMEVKGVTLEQNKIARFPDAPTERGIKHMRELQKVVKEGFEAYILFVIQMKGVQRFEPNDKTHKAFGDALREASNNGVNIMAVDCIVTRDSLEIDKLVEIGIYC